jgi:hypothetical protein
MIRISKIDREAFAFDESEVDPSEVSLSCVFFELKVPHLLTFFELAL